jgi:cbb3-type cytochrome c oxidase subunit III
MKALKLSIVLTVAALFGAACGIHETTHSTSNQTANKNAPAAAAINTNTAGGNNANAANPPSAAGDGAALYQATGCAICHGADGKGNPQMKDIPNFADAAWQKKTNDAAMINVIKNGKPPMPAYKNRLTDEQTKALVAYIRAFAK